MGAIEKMLKHSIDEASLKEKYPKFFNATMGEADWIRNQLCIASLFLMAYERFQDVVIERFQEFFTEGYQENKEGKVVPILGEDYQKAYNEFSKGEKKNKTLITACKWFQSLEAFTAEDIEVVRLITAIRNDLAHELLAVIVDDTKCDELSGDIINIPLNLLHKVTYWWLREIEVSVMPENYANFSEEEMANAQSLQVSVLLAIKDKVLKDPNGT